MFKFIWNFIFFGIIFYLIFRFLPKESTDAIIAWMDGLFDSVVELGEWVIEKISERMGSFTSGGS